MQEQGSAKTPTKYTVMMLLNDSTPGIPVTDLSLHVTFKFKEKPVAQLLI